MNGPGDLKRTSLRLVRSICLLILLALAVEQQVLFAGSSPSVCLLQLVQGTATQNLLTRQQRSRPETPSSRALAFPEGTINPEELKQLQSTRQRVEQDFQERKLPAPKVIKDGKAIFWTVDRAAINFFATLESETRYIALRLSILNETDQPIQVAGTSISATINGNPHSLQPLTEPLIHHGFTEGSIPHPLSACQPPEKITIPAGGLGSSWLIFYGLPAETQTPSTQLEFELQGKKITLDVREHQRAILDLSVSRIGLKESLALVTIGGRLNTFNAQSLVDELESLVSQKVIRAVLKWKPNSPPLDSQMATWLQYSAENAGTEHFASDQLPAIPTELRELHIVQHPSGGLADQNAGMNAGAAALFHADELTAVSLALRSSYVQASSEEVRQQIQQGHPLARASALMYGCQRLTSNDSSLVLPFTFHADAAIRRGAIMGLREFSESPVIDRLITLSQGPEETDASIAIAALADSRFQALTNRLRELLETADDALLTRVTTVLASPPRPAWSDILRKYAISSSGQLRMPAVKALVHLNHPDMIELLEIGLMSPEASVRDFVFPILSHRTDERSYRLAADYVLERLAMEPPDRPMLEFLARSRDQRALPSLMRHLKNADHRVPIIELLGQMGDQAVGDRLAADFPQFEAHEQVATLNALRALSHPQFLPIAKLGLKSTKAVVSHHAIRSLAAEGSPASISLLCNSLNEEQPPYNLDQLAMVLVSFATPESREALKRAASSTKPGLRSAGQTGLKNLWQNSPARLYVASAEQSARQRNWDEAVQLYEVATKMDPWFPEAQAGLGDVYLKQEQWEPARVHFQKALELNPNEGHAISGLAISRVMMNEMEPALALIQEARPRFTKDPLFLYNAACVYGRALQKIEQKPASPERETQLAEFRKRALADLKSSLNLGFNQIEWMQEDPDLRTLHTLEEFKELVRHSAAQQEPQSEPE